MKKVFTHNENPLLTQIEKDFCNQVMKDEFIVPKQTTIDNILNYSKALSVRESSIINHIEMVLN